MSVHASTIRILEAANFSTSQAVAIADAIDSGIRSEDVVTVPILDARLAQFEAKFDAKLDAKLAQLEVRLFWKMVGLGVAAAGVLIGAMHYVR